MPGESAAADNHRIVATFRAHVDDVFARTAPGIEAGEAQLSKAFQGLLGGGVDESAYGRAEPTEGRLAAAARAQAERRAAVRAIVAPGFEALLARIAADRDDAGANAELAAVLADAGRTPALFTAARAVARREPATPLGVLAAELAAVED